METLVGQKKLKWERMPCVKEIFLLAIGPPALAYALRISRKKDAWN
jgi:hypothetical protein